MYKSGLAKWLWGPEILISSDLEETRKTSLSRRAGQKHNPPHRERDCPTDPAARSLCLVFESARVRQALEALVEETP